MTEQAMTALPRPHRGLVTVALVVVGISLTVGALSVNDRRAEHAAESQTERAVENTAAAMRSDFERTEEIVSALAGFVMSSGGRGPCRVRPLRRRVPRQAPRDPFDAAAGLRE
ncbi:MAG: hypothetical protein M5U19_17265 [Microthrixaceae bacterium]|nr:hypothetical protein [Microthrixaceae bacterium]